MKSLLALVSILFAFALSSCKSDSTSTEIPPPGDSFLVRIAIQDNAGNPVGGLRISAWNQLAFSNSPDASPAHPMTTTTIEFSAPQPAHVSLAAYDLNHRLVAQIMDQDITMSGIYSATFSVNIPSPTRVFYCLLTAEEAPSGSPLFRDSVFAVLHRPDAAVSILGYASAAGTFETRDSVLFPNVLSLPLLVMTNATGPTPQGTFSITDTVVISLTDTTAHIARGYKVLVGDGTNDIHLIWNPTSGNAIELPAIPQPDGKGIIKLKRLNLHPTGWTLEQNYPNPFE